VIDVKALEKEEPRPETGRTYAEDYRLCLKNRSADPSLVDQLLELNRERKRCILEVETKKAHQNKVSQVIATKKRNKEDAATELAEMGQVSAAIKELEAKTNEADQKVSALAASLPNLLSSSVPVGKSDADNVVIRSHGTAPKFSFKAKEHWELGEKLGILDFERAGKVTGARFAFLKGPLAQLERALMNFKLDIHTREHGYTEMLPPYMVNTASYFGTGQFPKFVDDVFHVQGTDYHLASTAEVPVTNYFRDETLNEEELPFLFAAYSSCFRAEAGTYGKDTRGLIRQHQFQKVELLKFAHPSNSYEEHEKLTVNAERILDLLELPYQRVVLCSGDTGFSAAKTYDLNVWLPGQNAFREISSCSNFEDFQARRANIRFKAKGGGKPQFVHTINGSGLAIGRTVIAVMENYQQEDGSIAIPKVLQPYMGGLTAISAKA
jgi:seryl-tRNA synthetase